MSDLNRIQTIKLSEPYDPHSGGAQANYIYVNHGSLPTKQLWLSLAKHPVPENDDDEDLDPWLVAALTRDEATTLANELLRWLA